MDERWVSISEVATIVGLSRPTVRGRLKDGLIPGLHMHLGTPKVDRKTFEEWWVGTTGGKIVKIGRKSKV